LEPFDHSLSNHDRSHTPKRRRALENSQQPVRHEIGFGIWESSEHGQHAASSVSPLPTADVSEQANQLEPSALDYLDTGPNLVPDHTTTSSFIPHGQQIDESYLTNEQMLQWPIEQRVDDYLGWGAGPRDSIDYHQ
jgi:hypothetical protein